MSSLIDSGYSADKAGKEKERKCSKGGEHKWKRQGHWPSHWEECEKCGKTIYWK